MTLLLIALAVVPCAAILWWLFRSDLHPEPRGVVGVTVLMGAAASLPIVLVEMLLQRVLGIRMPPASPAEVLVMSFAIAALIEETFKFAILNRYCERQEAFDEPFDGVVYGAAASLGFAGVENLLFVLGPQADQSGFWIAAMRALTSVPLHALCGILMGSCIGIGHFSGAARVGWKILGLSGAVALHGIYDSFAFGAVFAGSRHSAAGVAFCVGGVGSTAVLAAATGVLGVAWMRHGQLRSMDAGPAPSASPPPGRPTRPLIALALVGTGAMALAIAIAVAAAMSLGPDGLPLPGNSPRLNHVGFGVAVSAVLAVAGVITAVAALMGRDRWILASTASLLGGVLLLGGILGMLMLT